MSRPKTVAVIIVSLMLFIGACTNPNGQADYEGPQHKPEYQSMQEEPVPGTLSGDAILPIKTLQNQSYIDLEEMIRKLEFNAKWDEPSKTYRIGDTDVVYEVKVDSAQAKKQEETVELPRETIRSNGKTWIPLEAVHKLFQDDMDYQIRGSQLILYPSEPTTHGDLNFADDPLDPAANREDFEGEALDIDDQDLLDQQVWSIQADENSVQAFTRKEVNANRLIATGKKYLGVDYEFGASKYKYSKRFDCSSFVQQLYNTYGVRLPRVSRDQAKYGISVSRKNLRKGDLLYFYVPGRFKSNKTVGHVGIYIGNNKMLHSSPAPKDGVQITNINKSYWKRTYLGAKRVIR